MCTINCGCVLSLSRPATDKKDPSRPKKITIVQQKGRLSQEKPEKYYQLMHNLKNCQKRKEKEKKQ